MKKLLSILSLASCAMLAMGQEKILPLTPNRDTTLSHSFAVVAEAKHNNEAQKLRHEIDALLAAQGLAISSVGVDSLPDMTIVLGGKSSSVAALIDSARGNYSQVMLAPLSGKANAKLIAQRLKKEYYSGSRPAITTIFTDGQNGYKSFRIPSVTRTASGAIIAFAEARADYRDQASNDLVCRVSHDNGATWGDLTVVAADGEASLNNPMAIYVEELDRVAIIYQRFPPATSEGAVKAGMDGDVVRCFIKYSDDHGQSWSEARDITRSVKPDNVASFCSGPGVGIRVTKGPNKGRIVVPMNVNGSPEWYNYLIYSDDLAQTWHRSSAHSAYGTNESSVVQISDTSFLVNARSHRNIADSSWAQPRGWSPWNFTRVTRHRANIAVDLLDSTARWHAPQIMDNQPDPTCQGSITRLGHFGDGKPSMVLLSNSASNYTFIEKRAYRATPPMRVNGTVKLSLDEGQTWAYAKRYYGNRATETQYSVLVDLTKGKIGCIFEANNNIKFAIFDLAWLSSGEIKK
ncbi:MAG: sialidase family protein [Mucinivorans sp.]